MWCDVVRDLHSFPTRRSSDLNAAVQAARGEGCSERLSLLLARAGIERVSSKLKDRKSTRLNSSHANISYAVFCLKKKTMTKLSTGTRVSCSWRSRSLRPSTG